MLPFRLTCIAASLLALSACGGGSDEPGRGALLEPPTTVATLSVAQIDATSASLGLQPLSGTAHCRCKVVALHYATPGRAAG